MAKWTYGSEGEAFPVQVGDLWRVGNHLFVCSDLMKSVLLDRALDLKSMSVLSRKPGLLYCDPPWGQGLLNGFRTKAGLAKSETSWQDLYKRIARIGHERRLPVFIEGSVITHRDGVQIPTVIREGLSTWFDHYWEVKYYRTHPSGLYYASARPAPLELTVPSNMLTGTDDDFTPGIVMGAYSSNIISAPATHLVVDPCAGRGVTSRQAQERGWASINNELNPNRVSASLVRMAKMIKQEPEKLTW